MGWAEQGHHVLRQHRVRHAHRLPMHHHGGLDCHPLLGESLKNSDNNISRATAYVGSWPFIIYKSVKERQKSVWNLHGRGCERGFARYQNKTMPLKLDLMQSSGYFIRKTLTFISSIHSMLMSFSRISLQDQIFLLQLSLTFMYEITQHPWLQNSWWVTRYRRNLEKHIANT